MDLRKFDKRWKKINKKDWEWSDKGYQLISYRDTDDQTILQSDWTRCATCHIQPTVVVSGATPSLMTTSMQKNSDIT